MSDYSLTPFEEVTREVPYLSAWQAVWNEAEELLVKTCPDGFTPEDVGRVAWDMLPEAEQLEALDALFYAWWSSLMADRERRAAFEEQAGGAR